MCPHWLISVPVYRSGNDTRCSGEGLWTLSSSHRTSRRTHKHTHTDCRHACMNLRANTDEQARTHTKTRICSLALTYTNTYTGSFLALALFHSLKHARTHTHTRWARRPDGITAWAVGLSHSGDLISHCFFSFTGPFSSRSSSRLPPFFSFLSTHPRLGFTFFLFFSIWPFYLFSDCRSFHFANNTRQRSIVSSRLFSSQWGELFLKTLFDSKGAVEGQELSHCDSGERKKITQLSWAITRKRTFTLAAVFLNQIRSTRKEGETLSPSTLWVVCAVNIDYRLKAIRIMEQKPCSLCQNVLGFGVQFIEWRWWTKLASRLGSDLESSSVLPK